MALFQTSSEPGRIEKPATSPTTELSEVLADEPTSPHQLTIEPVPARNCWNAVVPGSALIWSGGWSAITSITSWIARTKAGLLT